MDANGGVGVKQLGSGKVLQKDLQIGNKAGKNWV